jgi:hypothetical protein
MVSRSPDWKATKYKYFIHSFAGGAELGSSVYDMTNSHYTSAFTGCIKDIQLHRDTQPINIMAATRGYNVNECTNT